ncbi:hypothetical protein DPMN_053143 [Dreissena polymorpha]|uniref:Uncharacterized protein n=1 Tax=Dreissena polymorpha TaxID=45954 RepID=A0A9D4CM59_DREPO|nr:hypothetical protein DPMN_053143 [Dreissena polymorpha]
MVKNQRLLSVTKSSKFLELTSVGSTVILFKGCSAPGACRALTIRRFVSSETSS